MTLRMEEAGIEVQNQAYNIGHLGRGVWPHPFDPTLINRPRISASLRRCEEAGVERKPSAPPKPADSRVSSSWNTRQHRRTQNGLAVMSGLRGEASSNSTCRVGG